MNDTLQQNYSKLNKKYQQQQINLKFQELTAQILEIKSQILYNLLKIKR